MVFEKSFSVKSNDSSYNGLTVDEKFELLRKESDQFFLIVVSLFIFFMQAGFAFLEAGSVRSEINSIIVRFSSKGKPTLYQDEEHSQYSTEEHPGRFYWRSGVLGDRLGSGLRRGRPVHDWRLRVFQL